VARLALVDRAAVIREYPRLSTTVIDAYVGPTVGRYLSHLPTSARRRRDDAPAFPHAVQRRLMRLSIGARFPNQTLLSGPAAGVVAATELGRITGQSHLITFDMGGTSTDISVIVDGRVLKRAKGGSPVKISARDAQGAHAGRRRRDARVDRQGCLLKVGPHSAGAAPGPACYGRGGGQPTVTDANLVLGALSGAAPLAGKFGSTKRSRGVRWRRRSAHARARRRRGRRRDHPHRQHQHGRRLRLALQEEGQDPRRFALVAFGGAGPIHAAQLARDLGIRASWSHRTPGSIVRTGCCRRA